MRNSLAGLEEVDRPMAHAQAQGATVPPLHVVRGLWVGPRDNDVIAGARSSIAV